MENKRYFSRIEFEGKTVVRYKETDYIAELHDISLKGALICFKAEVPIALNELCHVELTLPSSDIVLTFESEIVHRHEMYAGLKFYSISSETLTHLRMLIELNIGDHEQTTSELAFWLK